MQSVCIPFRCFLEPFVPPVEGLELFPSDHMIHYSEYQAPHSYKDKVVLVTGNESWGHVIVREVAAVAKEIIMISKQENNNDIPNNVQRFPYVTRIVDKQMVQFSDGISKRVDIIILCTSQRYLLPYLHDSCGFNVADKQGAYPLYKMTFNPYHPSMAFLGTVVDSTFAFSDMQVMWALREWLGLQPLPHSAEMLVDCKKEMDKDLAVLYEELAGYSKTRAPSSALLGILNQIDSQAEEKTKSYTVLSSEHWIVTNN